MSNKEYLADLIPEGPYCYKWITLPAIEGGKLKAGKIDLCPYFKYKQVKTAKYVWCGYLNKGGTSFEHESDEEWEKNDKILIDFFGGEDKMRESLELFVLFDHCKCCGVNEGEE